MDTFAPSEQTEMPWRPIGTVVGNAGIAEFTFILRQFQARVGDIVALGMYVPDGSFTQQTQIYVWARIIDIRRFNPFFPFEAGQELAAEGISLESTVLAGTRDQLEASALIIGATTDSNLSNLFPLTYPVKPASTVYHPPTEAVRQLLIGEVENEQRVRIGSLIARQDVEVTISAPKLVARHLAILAMTGGGKTVAARRIIRELISLGYPLLILDPHGDYIGMSRCERLFQEEAPNCTVKLFYPELLIQKDGEELITKLILQMTNGITEPQSNYLRALYERVSARQGQKALDYIGRLLGQTTTDLQSQGGPPSGLQGATNWKPTVHAVARSLRIALDRLSRMERSSEQMRNSSKLKTASFESPVGNGR